MKTRKWHSAGQHSRWWTGSYWSFNTFFSFFWLSCIIIETRVSSFFIVSCPIPIVGVNSSKVHFLLQSGLSAHHFWHPPKERGKKPCCTLCQENVNPRNIAKHFPAKWVICDFCATNYPRLHFVQNSNAPLVEDSS